MAERILEISGLKTFFFTPFGVAKAVDGLDLWLDDGDTLALVGESGCGKTVTALSIMRLIQPPGKTVEGKILFKGKDLISLSSSEMRKIRGNEISVIFQEPMTSLNPVIPLGDQIGEVFMAHQGFSKKEALKRAIEMLKLVKIPSPEKRIKDYPHQLSGGMRQRVMIAIALALKPKLVIADEPTTALDVTIQAQIMRLMEELKKEAKTSLILITHDLGLVFEIAQKVVVMYAGKAVEIAPVATLFQNPKHPYTVALMASLPRGDRSGRLKVIPGFPPALTELPPGCKFYPRCEVALSICSSEEPDLYKDGDGHLVRCFKYG